MFSGILCVARFLWDGSQFHYSSCDRDRTGTGAGGTGIRSVFMYKDFNMNKLSCVPSAVVAGGWLVAGCHLTSAWSVWRRMVLPPDQCMECTATHGAAAWPVHGVCGNAWCSHQKMPTMDLESVWGKIVLQHRVKDNDPCRTLTDPSGKSKVSKEVPKSREWRC